MLYIPKFCCECGEKIERAVWKLWTSRRFCERCEADFKKHEWRARALVFSALLIGIFGAGSLLRKTEKPLNVTTQTAPAATASKNQNAQTIQTATANTNLQNSAQKQSVANNTFIAPPPLMANRKNAASGGEQIYVTEAVYMCGAQTKKGTACSRRVKGGGRCFQHLGQPAIVPRDKLLVTQ